jgi:hypothetical protein
MDYSLLTLSHGQLILGLILGPININQFHANIGYMLFTWEIIFMLQHMAWSTWLESRRQEVGKPPIIRSCAMSTISPKTVWCAIFASYTKLFPMNRLIHSHLLSIGGPLVSRAAVTALNPWKLNVNESHYNEPIPAKPLHWNYYQLGSLFWNRTRFEYELRARNIPCQLPMNNARLRLFIW